MKVTYLDHMGSDLDVVNDARVSFGKESKLVERDVYENSMDAYPVTKMVLSDADKSLIAFLARGCTSGDWEDIKVNVAETLGAEYLEPLLNHVRKMPSHWVPFANGGTIKLHFKVPIFIARQLQKHQAGFEPQSEVSRRYVTEEPEFYVPETWRKAADNVKQGSSAEVVDPGYTKHELYGYALDTYLDMLNEGVCPEQARMVLPQSMYTEYRWKGNLYAWANLYNVRTDSHAQAEVREVARQIGDIIEPLFPVSWKELT